MLSFLVWHSEVGQSRKMHVFWFRFRCMIGNDGNHDYGGHHCDRYIIILIVHLNRNRNICGYRCIMEIVINRIDILVNVVRAAGLVVGQG